MPRTRVRMEEERLRSKRRNGERLTRREARTLGGEAWADETRGPH